MLKEFLTNTFLNLSFNINQTSVLNTGVDFISSVELSKLINLKNIDLIEEKENGCYLISIRCSFTFYEKMKQQDI